jgi:ribose transport system permease protein
MTSGETTMEKPKQTASAGRQLALLLLRFGTPLLFLILCFVVSRFSPLFLTARNARNVLLQTASVGTVAIGMTFVLIARGVDISVGGSIALGSLLSVLAMKNLNWPWYAGIAIMFGVSILIGFVNGFSTARLGMASFLVTLATLTIVRGLVLAVSAGKSSYGLPAVFEKIGWGSVGIVPSAVAVTLLGFLVGHIVLSRSVFGRQVYAVGGNPEAARMQGINVTRVTILAFTLCGFFTGLAGLILTSRLNAFTPLMGAGFEFSAIAAVVIGGTSLFGGEGSMGGTLVGVLIIGVINNALNLAGVSVFYQDVAKGAIIFLAVLVDTLRRRLAQASA